MAPWIGKGAGGAPLSWPADVPATVERPEIFVVIFADRPQDLQPLETPRGTRSPLEQALDAVRDGAREMPVEQDLTEPEPLRYRVDRLIFCVRPCTEGRREP